MASSCSKSEPLPGLPDGVRVPNTNGGDCTDPVGDIGSEVRQGEGSLFAPAGIDIVQAESRVIDGVLKTKFTMAGPVKEAPQSEVVVLQGNAGNDVSFELRAAPAGVDPKGPWAIKMITWKKEGGDAAFKEKSAPLTAPVKVDDRTISFDIPTKDLPQIVTLIWQWGASSGNDDSALFDDCNSIGVQTRGSEVPAGSTTVTTAVPLAALGQEQAFKATSKVTVYEAQTPPKIPKSLTILPDEGFQLAVVDAQVCAAGDRIDARSQFFGIKLTTNQIYPIWNRPVSGADPAFPTVRSLSPGECIRGWITFQLPVNSAIGTVLYSPATDGSGAVQWKV